MKSHRLLALLAATALATLLPLGCGETSPNDPTARYSPESLAQEFAFRYKELKSSGTLRPSPAPVPSIAKEAAAKKEAGIPKKARAQTVADLVDDIIAKAEAIPDISPPAARKKIAELIDQDESIEEADRKLASERLSRSGD